ncbi:MAG: low molecular weight phosphotyrosine protein phosphatase [Anaerolineales bacterium]|nr:low molecular weight phosphotyrosine protein phosphatase [Anaerolineales bacterium]
MKTHISFVCSGNICRSPMAEGIFRHLVEAAGLGGDFEIESAGVGPWHVGEAADTRARQTARRHGIELDGVAQQITAQDFSRLDHVIALDRDVAAHLRGLASNAADRAKIRLLREYDPQAGSGWERDLDVPDPYYGGSGGFELAFQMIDRAARQLLAQLRVTE